MKIRDKVKKLI